jgi:shikimate dehydrogenase
MDLYCVVGNPVEHSRSPRIHARFAELCGQQMDYGRRLVPIGAFAEGIAAFREEAAERGDRARGCNITVPFKFEAASLAQHTSERAKLAQAVNTLRFADDGSIHADNTDGIGLVSDIVRNAAVPLQGKALLLIGAGGAAAGVLGPLLDAGASRVVVANRTVGKAVELVRRHAAIALRHGASLEAWALDEVPGTFDVVINATASSLAGDAVPVNAAVLREGGLAVDMMYGPAAAGVMAWADAPGAGARDGLGMLVEQAAEAFEIWRGVRPPSAQVLAEVRASLATPA